MKIQALSDLQSEINRLFIAGAKLSKDDPRLSRLVPTLSRLGERAPVFLKLSEDLETLVSAAPDKSAEKLLELGTLLYSILNTQGDTSLQGDFLPMDPTAMNDTDTRTDQKYSRLYPLMEALTSQKPGRLEVIRQAFKDGLFADIRTHGPAAAALEDHYAEIVRELEEIIIPSIGKPAIPHLLRQYDPLGEHGAARRLSLLGRLGFAGSGELALSALNGDKTSIPVSIAAIGILGHDSKNEELLLTLSRDKKKDIREAALAALVQIDSERGKRTVLDIFRGVNYKSAVEPLADCLDLKVKLEALEVLKACQQDCLTGDSDKKEASSKCEKLVACAGVLRSVEHPQIIEYIQDAMTSARLRKILSEHANMLQEFYGSLLEVLSGLKSSESDRALETLAHDRDIQKVNVGVMSYWFAAAARTRNKKDMFKEFADAYRDGLLDSRNFQNVYENASMIDERWIDEFLYPNMKHQINDRILAIRMIKADDTKHIKELVKVLEDDLRRGGRYVPDYLKELLEKLFEARVPKAYALLERAIDNFNIVQNYYIPILFKAEDDNRLIQYLTLEEAERLMQKYGNANGGRYSALFASIINYKKSEVTQ